MNNTMLKKLCVYSPLEITGMAGKIRRLLLPKLSDSFLLLRHMHTTSGVAETILISKGTNLPSSKIASAPCW